MTDLEYFRRLEAAAIGHDMRAFYRAIIQALSAHRGCEIVTHLRDSLK